jgi:hypothetical protein
MAKKNVQGEANKEMKDAVRLRAPKGVAAIGIPIGDAVIEVKVPSSGIVEVDLSLTDKLVEAGFVAIRKEMGDEE